MSSATALLADAERSISSGAWDQALEQLEGLKQSEPNEADVYRRLAYVLSIRGKFRSVIDTYVQLTSVLIQDGQHSEAERIIATVLALYPECESAREQRIQIEKQRGNIDRAVYLARELARLCIEQGDGDRSIRLLQEAQKDQPENLDISLELAEMFVSHGQIQDGANQYRKVANAFQGAGNINKAAEAYRRMKVVQSDDPEVLLTLGRLYTELGKLDEAEQEFRSVLRHDLEHQDALMELGLVCQLKGRFRSGLLAFNKVLQNNDKLPKAMRKLGELNLSMGKQEEAVQHFLEAAQAYLEADERDEAVEVFQLVLGVDSGNAQAQQGLTNLGAPLEPKEFVPPLPPNPPADEPPTPDAGLVSASDLGDLPPPQFPTDQESRSEGSSEGRPSSAAKTYAGSGAATKKGTTPAGGGSSGARKGLVSGGMGLRRGLVDPGGGAGKPMLGKPTLGGGGAGRAGLRRPGLGMKDGGGGDKPMLGMSSGGAGMAKPTLDRRSVGDSGDSRAEAEVEEVFDFEAPVVEADEPLPDFSESRPEERQESTDLDFSASVLFDDEDDTDAGDSDLLLESLFDDSGPSAAPSPVIGSFSPVADDESIGLDSSLRPGFEPGTAEGQGESADDIFDLSGAELFSDSEADTGSLFDDESLPRSGMFDSPVDLDSGTPADDLFGGFDDEPVPTASSVGVGQEEQGAGDLFGGGGFDNLFDDEDTDDRVSASDTIGKPGSGDDLFGTFPSEASAGQEESDSVGAASFDSLFFDDDSSSGDDLFSTAVETSQQPAFMEESTTDAGKLFEAEPSGNDLFGEELFPSEAPAESSEAEVMGSDDSFPAGGDLFSEFDQSDNLFGEASASSANLFSEVEEVDQTPADDLFGGGLFDEPSSTGNITGENSFLEPTGGEPAESDFDLFSEPSGRAPLDNDFSGGGLFDGFEEQDASPAEPVTGGGDSDLFGESSAVDDLFGGSGEDDLFGEQVERAPAVAAEPEQVQAFDFGDTALDLGSADDLFGGAGTETPEAVEIPESAHGEESVDDLFQTDTSASGGLFDDPAGDMFADAGSLFDEPGASSEAEVAVMQAEMETYEDAGGLFGSLSPEVEMEPPAPLDLELPMPGDPPLALEPEPEPELVSFDEPLFPEPMMVEEEPEFSEDALTMDRLRAEEMAKVVDLPEEDPVESPEFMKLLELTLPKPEEEAPPEPEPAVSEQEPSLESGEGDLFSSTEGSLEIEGDLFDTSQSGLFSEEQELLPESEPEPEPVDEGPAILGKPKVSLSIEDESPASDVEQTNRLDASLVEADVATKVSAYRKALDESPENLVMRSRLADLHLKYGMLEDALLQYRQVMRKNSESISLLHKVIQAEFWTENYAEAGESLLALAKLHLKRGELHDSLDLLQSVLSLDPHHFEARKVLVSVFTTLDESKLAAHHLRQLAETAMTKGEVEEAISAFQQLLEISNDPVFEERLGQIYESQGDMERALRSFQSLVGRYQEEGRFEEAARVTERIVELNPELLDDRGALVQLYKKLGMEDNAMEQQFKLATAYQDRGELVVAVELLEGVLEHTSDNQEARRRLVDAYLDSGNVKDALEQSEALTEHYLNTKDHQTAIELYTRLVEADPENIELQERLVKFYGLAGDPESARVRWIQLSQLHGERGRFEKSAEAIQKALELDENQIDLQHKLALLYADKLDNPVAALSQLRKLFQLAPDRLDAVQMYIDILLKQEQVSEAGQVLQQLEQAGGESLAIKNDVITTLRNQVESNPTDLKARFNYGELCYHLGDLDHAIEQFQQTRRNPEFELQSYNMLGLCFAKKKGFNMLDLAIKQFKKGLETRGHSEQSYLELRYNLAGIQYQNGRLKEALNDFKECYRVDITYRDVRSWIEKIEAEMASSGS